VKFLSLFDGCHMFGLGARRAGFGCAGTSEIDTHAANVTRYHYPNTPQLGDVRDVGATDADLIIGGFPCQDLSVAGDRRGLAGERSGLFWEIVRIARDSSTPWILLENVPGLLSSNGGQDMGTVVGALGQLGYGWAYRVLDAQYLGVPQRRRRVFIVGCLGDARRAGEVLFEPESVRGNPAPRRAPWSKAARAAGVGFDRDGDASDRRGLAGDNDVARCLTHHSGRYDGDTETLTANMWEKRDNNQQAFSQRGANYVPTVADMVQITSATNRSNPKSGDPAPTLATSSRLTAFNWRADDFAPSSVSPCLDTDGSGSIATHQSRVRRLMPVECERLQGLPDDWTRYGRREDGTVYEMSNSARYKMIGNGGYVGAVEWIARRIIDTGC
jgi:DNA (cytosine-5)-methyltransferase 1